MNDQEKDSTHYAKVPQVLSFIYVRIYWDNHHHLLRTTRRMSAGILWSNLHLLFWLSLFPFATAWMERMPIPWP